MNAFDMLAPPTAPTMNDPSIVTDPFNIAAWGQLNDLSSTYNATEQLPLSNAGYNLGSSAIQGIFHFVPCHLI